MMRNGARILKARTREADCAPQSKPTRTMPSGLLRIHTGQKAGRFPRWWAFAIRGEKRVRICGSLKHSCKVSGFIFSFHIK